MQSVRIALVGVALLFGNPAAAQTAKSFDMDVGTVRLQGPLPAGFCTPAGGAIAKADQGVRSDPENATLATLYACGQMQNDTITDYFLIKAPKNLLGSTFTREEVLAALTKELTDPNFSAEKLSSTASDKASKSVSEASGTSTQVTTDIRPLGRDGDCAYMGGLVAANTDGTIFKLNVGGCITAVEGRLLMVFRYTSGTTLAAAANLLPETRRLAMSLRARP